MQTNWKWNRFLEFHKVEKRKGQFSVEEWQNYFFLLGEQSKQFYSTSWLQSRSFRFLSTTDNITFLDDILVGFHQVNEQLPFDLSIQNPYDPIIVKPEEILKITKEQETNRDYGLLIFFEGFVSESEGVKYSDSMLTGGFGNSPRGYMVVESRSKGFSQNKITKKIRQIAAHELMETLTPRHVPHCNEMSPMGEYMIEGPTGREYHHKRCVFAGNYYKTVCHLCKDMSINFFRGLGVDV